MKSTRIIGREEELRTMERIYQSDKSEMLAIYGRRRVGKSFLVEEAFRGKICFSTVGVYKKLEDGKDEMKQAQTHKESQLLHFYDDLIASGLPAEGNPRPTSWREGFLLLRTLLQRVKSRRKVVFIDELPWLAGPQSSELIEELGFFWNNWADKQRNIVLIICGSATSWMLDNVLRDYGGLHGRLTETIYLKPFTLGECESYWAKRGFHLSRYEIALTYMTIGGVPYYMGRIHPDRTMADNIDALYFNKEKARTEFKDVYTGLFSSSEKYIDIVRALGARFYGMTRNELIEAAKISGGGTFTKLMSNLIESGIVKTYPRYGGKRVQTVYQLCDFFSIFFLTFVEPGKKTSWRSLQRTHEFFDWAGHAFELLVSEHTVQLKDALRIKYADATYSYLGPTPEGKTAQIDLVVPATTERTDYLCEMKYSEGKYAITTEYEEKLTEKLEALRNSSAHKRTHSILLVLVTTFGLTTSKHNGHVNMEVTLDELFG